MSLATGTKYRITFKKQTPKPSTAKTPLHSCNMLKQKLHHFCSRSSPDDGPKVGQKVLGIHANYGQYINQFPQNTIKVIREFRTDPKGKYVDIKCLLRLMKFALTKKCCLNIHIYIIYIYMVLCYNSNASFGKTVNQILRL